MKKNVCPKTTSIASSTVKDARHAQLYRDVPHSALVIPSAAKTVTESKDNEWGFGSSTDVTGS